MLHVLNSQPSEAHDVLLNYMQLLSQMNHSKQSLVCFLLLKVCENLT